MSESQYELEAETKLSLAYVLLEALPTIKGAGPNDPLHITHHGSCCAERQLNAVSEQPLPFYILRL